MQRGVASGTGAGNDKHRGVKGYGLGRPHKPHVIQATPGQAPACPCSLSLLPWLPYDDPIASHCSVACSAAALCRALALCCTSASLAHLII